MCVISSNRMCYDDDDDDDDGDDGDDGDGDGLRGSFNNSKKL